MEDNIILRNEPADYVAHNVLDAVLEGIRGDDLLEWHRARLKRLYISKNDKIEVEITLDRGWDTKMSFELDSNPEESVDRLTDHLYNNIKQTVRSCCEEHFDVDFDSREKIDSVRIRQKTAEYTSHEERKYMVEFDTEVNDETIVTDHRMSSQPRICGRRLLVSWIWSKHVRQDMDATEIAEDYGTVTESEVLEAIEFAEESSEFESREEMTNQTDDSEMEFVGVDELKASLSDETPEERLDVEDNR